MKGKEISSDKLWFSHLSDLFSFLKLVFLHPTPLLCPFPPIVLPFSLFVSSHFWGEFLDGKMPSLGMDTGASGAERFCYVRSGRGRKA